MIQLAFKPDSTDSKSLSAVTTGTGVTLCMDNCRQIIYYGQVTGTPSAGAAVFEIIDIPPDYAGQWWPVDTVDVTSPAFTTAGICIRATYPGLIIYCRWRITTPFAGTGTTFTGGVNALRL